MVHLRLLFQQLRMESGNPVGAMRADNAKIGHVNAFFPILVRFFHNWHSPHSVKIAGMLLCHWLNFSLLLGLFNINFYIHKSLIDQIDDLQMAGQQMFQHAHRPSFQRLGKECVIGVGECSNTNVPCLLETQSLHVDKQSNQFGNADWGMRVIQLDGNLQNH